MRVRVTLGLLVCCIVASAAGTGQSRSVVAAAPVCGPSSAETLLQDSVARIYDQDQITYGCALPSGQAITLGGGSPLIRPAAPPSAGPFALAGTIVAYGWTQHGIGFASTAVLVQQLTDGQQVTSLPAVSGDLGPMAVTSVGSIVVRPDGAAAWIGTGKGRIAVGQVERLRRRTQVFRAKGAQAQLLDHSRSRSIAVGSLRLRGSRLTWKHGHRTRRATLD